MSDLSKRGKHFLDFEFKMEEYFKQVAANPYHRENNPEGIIDMGSSTNGIVTDLIMSKISSVDMKQLPTDYFNTCEVQGPYRFRSIMASFFNHYLKPKLSIRADDVFIQAGAGSVFESVGFALLDPGDVILLPEPYYYQFDHEFTRVSGAQLITFPVTLSPLGDDICTIKNEELALAHEKAIQKGLNVKVILLVNPNNPMGYIFDEDALKLCVEFSNRHNNIHVISDEIYMHCVFGDAQFQSVLNLPGVDYENSNIHVIWAFSKEFAVAGFRIGVLITRNESLKAVMNEDLNKRVSNLTLYVMESIVSDLQWLDTIYYPEFLSRLRTITDYVRNKLESVGVICFPSKAGLFIWANFRKYSDTLVGGDMELFDRLMNNNIYVSPGQAFKCKERGWFRVITSLSNDVVFTGITRILQVLKGL